MPELAEVLLNSLASSLRGWRGSIAKVARAQTPEKPLKLYDLESCPYCRLVREVLTELDLDVLILPCPKNGRRFRDQAPPTPSGRQFPILVDDNTATTIGGSAEIIDYLRRTYGRGAGPAADWRHHLNVLSSSMASSLHVGPRGLRGLYATPSRAPAQPLELYSFESSPYCQRVRLRLCELELPYLLRNTGKGRWSDMGPPAARDLLFKGPKDTTRNRRWLAEHTGRVQLPYLIDPNTGTQMYESGDILVYLDRTYAES